MRWWGLVCITLTLVGCVAPTEVKTASSDVGVALRELSSAQAEFRDALIAELDVNRDLIVATILAEAVKRKVEALTNAGFGDDPVITLSNSIQSARDAARKRVAMVLQANAKEPPEETEYETFVKSTLTASIEAAERLVPLIEAEDPEEAQQLREEVAEIRGAVASEEEVKALVDLLQNEANKQVVIAGMSDLANYVKFLRMIHEPVHDWISTDVTVQGEQLAKLIDDHAELIGLGGGR